MGWLVSLSFFNSFPLFLLSLLHSTIIKKLSCAKLGKYQHILLFLALTLFFCYRFPVFLKASSIISKNPFIVSCSLNIKSFLFLLFISHFHHPSSFPLTVVLCLCLHCFSRYFITYYCPDGRNWHENSNVCDKVVIS